MGKLTCFLLALLCFCSVSLAQLTRGFISGTVQDPSGAVVDGVKVTILNKETNIRREASTNAIGVYRFVAVEPGIYSVEFAKLGFEPKRLENIEVRTTQEVVLNQALAVATSTTTVVVQESAPGVDLSKSSATIDQKLDRRFIENVPFTGATRDVTRAVLLAPTVVRGPGSNEFSANGQRARNNNFMVDGVDNNDLSVTLTNNRVIPEAVAEFQTQTSSYSAEYGRNSGAQVNIITRSGTNLFHGDAWDYYRGNWMEPVSLLNKRAGVTKTPRFVHNQAGGGIGGPIRKDRTFFFGLIETNRRREAPDARNATSVTIPTPAGFAALSSVPLDPTSGQTAASRKAVLDSLAFLNDIYPKITLQNIVNTPINGVPIEVGTGRIPLSNPSDYWYYQGRIDHKLTDNGNLSYRIQVDKRNQPDFISNLGFGSLFSGAQTVLGQNHMLSETHSVTPRFVNEFRMGYTRRNLDFPENAPTMPTVTISNSFTIGGLSNFPQGRVSNTFQWQDVATWMRNRHSLKFGVDIRRNRLFNRAGFDSKGTWTFSNFADFINNKANSLRQAVNESTFDARQTNQYYFIQDDIKVTKNLSVNVGLRYEYSGTPFGFFGATQPEVRAVGVPGPTVPDKNNWAPRFGLAWSPSAKNGLLGKLLGDGLTVFRGGYGITYDVLFYNILTVNASNYPRVVVSELPNLTNVYPQLLPKQASVKFDPLATFVNSPEDLQNPTTHFYSFSIQREFMRSNVFEAGYTGSRSYHGIRQGSPNPGILTAAQAATVIATRNVTSIPNTQARRLNPAWGQRVSIESTAIGNYNAMFLRYDRKFTHGLLLGASYTWSANFSDNDESLGVTDITNGSSQVPQDFFNYKPDYARSAFDRTNRFVVHYSYNIPWRDGGSKVLKHILGGWMVTGFSEWQSGMPFTLRTGVDSGGTGTTGPFRPNFNPNGTITKDPDTGNFRTFKTAIDGAGIGVTPLGTNGLPLANSMPGGGTLGKGVFRGPAYAGWNFSLQKQIPLTERWRLRLRSDWINMWNHRNFLIPNPFMNNPSAFGTNTSDPGGRTMLLSAKITF